MASDHNTVIKQLYRIQVRTPSKQAKGCRGEEKLPKAVEVNLRRNQDSEAT